MMRQQAPTLFVDEVSEAVNAYNAVAQRCGWPRVQKLSPARRVALCGRLKDCGGPEGWRDALSRAEQSDFLCGRTARPWTGFCFDWLTVSANFIKLMEGNYDNRPGVSPRNPRLDSLPGILDVAGRMRRTSEPDWL